MCESLFCAVNANPNTHADMHTQVTRQCKFLSNVPHIFLFIFNILLRRLEIVTTAVAMSYREVGGRGGGVGCRRGWATVGPDRCSISH